ncbi:ceramide synthase 1-like [Corticium candelabrum]|uniref:ceramide synthase 1-like n=1 Tax=Corticium candelabrum TaxID=121492 RepID=UPI002E270BB8|nr:ceramide synthase 1-like [Corticium candelabrum]
MSSPVEVLTNIWSTCQLQLSPTDPSKYLVQEFIEDMVHHTSMEVIDVVYCVLVAVVFTVVRAGLNRCVYEPFVKKVDMDEKEALKFPESAFKVLYYALSWGFCYYLVVTKYELWNHPVDVWKDWERGMAIPLDIYGFYIFQLGLYLHALYATCFLDDVRRDFIMMIVHHLLTIALIGFSFTIRYHLIGLIVIFLHDLNDVILDGSKCLLYMQHRGGKVYPRWDHAATVGFLTFSVVWFIMRLYWYFYKVLYSTGYISIVTVPTGRFYLFFNGMLWLLFFINIYWFYFILQAMYRVVTGQELKDTREREDKKEEMKKD